MIELNPKNKISSEIYTVTDCSVTLESQITGINEQMIDIHHIQTNVAFPFVLCQMFPILFWMVLLNIFGGTLRIKLGLISCTYSACTLKEKINNVIIYHIDGCINYHV